jgi:hypothetical protein
MQKKLLLLYSVFNLISPTKTETAFHCVQHSRKSFPFCFLFFRNLQQFGIQHASEEWKSADIPRNLQQLGIQNV